MFKSKKVLYAAAVAVCVIGVICIMLHGDTETNEAKRILHEYLDDLDINRDTQVFVEFEGHKQPERSIAPDNCSDDDREAVKAFVKSLDYSSWHSKKYDPAEHEDAQGGIEFGISITGQDSSLSVICVGDRECIVSLYTDGNKEPDAYAVFICGVKEYRALCDICGAKS